MAKADGAQSGHSTGRQWIVVKVGAPLSKNREHGCARCRFFQASQSFLGILRVVCTRRSGGVLFQEFPGGIVADAFQDFHCPHSAQMIRQPQRGGQLLQQLIHAPADFQGQFPFQGVSQGRFGQAAEFLQFSIGFVTLRKARAV